MHKLSKPQCRIIGIQRGQNVQDEGAKELGANKPENKQAKGRRSQAQGANQPGGERTRGRTSQGANRQRGEKARHRPTIHPPIIVYVLTVSQSRRAIYRLLPTKMERALICTTKVGKKKLANFW